jgi:hypothetical protein
MHPEARARETIDALLKAAGWLVQDRDEINLGAPAQAAPRRSGCPVSAGCSIASGSSH